MAVVVYVVQTAPPASASSTVTPAQGVRVAQSQVRPTSPTPAPQNTEQPLTVDDVVVVAERPAVLNQIDRRIYDIGRDPAAQTSPLIEILQKVPSVSVDPQGRVRLLGQANVSILIDGQRPASADAVLRTLTGANIDRIEVMTNPGVQYGPVGTGGIINIITKQRTTPGVTGTLVATGETLGTYRLVLSPIWTVGRWTTSSNVTLSTQTSEDRSSSARDVFAAPGVVASHMDEFYLGETDARTVVGTLKFDFRLSDAQRFNLSLDAGTSTFDSDRRGRFVSPDAPLTDHAERSLGDIGINNTGVTLGYTRTGPQDGEELTLAAKVGVFGFPSSRDFSSDYVRAPSFNSAFRTVDDLDMDDQSLKVDYKRPLSGDRITTAGFSWERNGQTIDRSLQTLTGPALSSSRHIDSARNVTAVYGTLQFGLAGFTVLPGLRLEYQDFAIASAGTTGGNSGFDLYPSLHLDRPINDDLKLGLSYARRINRPDAQRLDPALNFSRALEASRGNPDLRPQTTDSFEARLDYTQPRWSLSATAYDKESQDLWTYFEERRPDGLIISTTINAGTASDRGLELSARGRLQEGFSYVSTVNLFASTKLVQERGTQRDRTDFAYTSSLQLEYAAPTHEGLEAEKIQLSVTYNGPRRFFQAESAPYVNANLTWRRPLTRRTTAVLTALNVFNNASGESRTLTDTFSETSRYDNRGSQLRLGLTYRLGVIP